MEGCSYPLSTFRLTYVPGVSYRYQYVTHTILNEAQERTAVDDAFSPHQQQKQGVRRDVGFMLSADLRFTPIWAGDSGLMVVKLQVTL